MGLATLAVQGFRSHRSCVHARLMSTVYSLLTHAALGSIAWELLHRGFHVGIRTTLGRAPWLVLDAVPKASRKTLLDDGGWFMCTLTHACIVGPRGCMHVWALLNAPIAAQLSIPLNVDDAYFAAAAATETTNFFFLSWLLYDLAHLLHRHVVHGQKDVAMICHHIGFITASIICGTHRALPFAFGWLITGEISSIALNLRWFLLQSGRSEGVAMRVVQLAFAAAFVATRICVGGVGLGHLLYHYEAAVGVMGASRRWLAQTVLVLLCGGFGLNCMWLRKILAMATRGSGKGARTRKAGHGK